MSASATHGTIGTMATRKLRSPDTLDDSLLREIAARGGVYATQGAGECLGELTLEPTTCAVVPRYIEQREGRIALLKKLPARW